MSRRYPVGAAWSRANTSFAFSGVARICLMDDEDRIAHDYQIGKGLFRPFFRGKRRARLGRMAASRRAELTQVEEIAS